MIDPGAFRRPLLGQPFDWTHPLAVGLAECYALMEGGGPHLFDHCSRQVAARQTGTAAWGAVDHSRWRGHKVALDGSTYYQSPSHTLGFSDAVGITIECLVKPAAAASRQTIYGRNNAAGAPQMEIGNSGGPQTVTVLIAGTFASAASTVSNGTWVHACYSRNPATLGTSGTFGHEWTVDGVHFQTPPTANTATYVDAAAVTLIGARASGSQLLNGEIAWLRVWRRYLPPADRLWLYREPWAMAGARSRRTLTATVAPVGRIKRIFFGWEN